MKDYLRKIRVVIGEDLEGRVQTDEKLESSFSMNTKASVEAIAHCDTSLEKQLPEDYKFFLENYDGGVLFQIEDFIGFKLLGTNNIVSENDLQKNCFGDSWDNQIILFCRCLGDAEYFAFKIIAPDQYQILHCLMEDWPEYWKIINNNFDEFISKLIDEEGRPFWFDDEINGTY